MVHRLMSVCPCTAAWLVSAFFGAAIAGCGNTTEQLGGGPLDSGDSLDSGASNTSESRPSAGSDQKGDAGSANRADAATASDTDVTSASPNCEAPRFDDPTQPSSFARLAATVLDDAGNPVPNILAQACGLNICLQNTTDGQGRVTISSQEDIAKAAFKYGDGLHYAQLALRLDANNPTHELGDQYTLAFPKLADGERLEAGAALVSSGATLALTDDAQIKIDRLSFPDETEHVFVAREFDLEALPQAVQSEGFDAVWALGPLKTEFCPPAALTLPNTQNLPPGASVAMYLHVTDTGGHWARYTEWGKVATGTVTDNGQQIVTDADQGVPELGVIGIRLSSAEGP